MKLLTFTIIVLIYCINICFAQSSITSRDIIKDTNNKNSAYSEIKARTNRDIKLNKLDNDLNFYRNKNDSISNQKVIELENQKSKIINIK